MSEHNVLNELAFENGFGAASPPMLWRLSSYRHFKERRIRHINWFASKESADIHAAWLNDGRGEVIEIVQYPRVNEGMGRAGAG